VRGCYLTKIEASAATLELRVALADPAQRDALRARLIGALAQHFIQFAQPANAERPSFG
jgi:hypothetical protein